MNGMMVSEIVNPGEIKKRQRSRVVVKSMPITPEVTWEHGKLAVDIRFDAGDLDRMESYLEASSEPWKAFHPNVEALVFEYAYAAWSVLVDGMTTPAPQVPAPVAPVEEAPAPAPAPTQGIYNGHYTVVLGSEHVTFKVRDDDFSWMTSKPAPGTRAILYLTGPDNESDSSYRSCGMITPDGRIVLWKKYRDGNLQTAANVLSGNIKESARQYALASQRCNRCNRLLTNDESLRAYEEDGLGPICRQLVWG